MPVADSWQPVWVAAAWFHRPNHTIRTWAKRGLIRRRTTPDGLQVHMGDVHTMHNRAQQRTRPV